MQHLYSALEELEGNFGRNTPGGPSAVIASADKLRLEAHAVLREHGNKGKIKKNAEEIKVLCIKIQQLCSGWAGVYDIFPGDKRKKITQLISQITELFKAIALELKFEFKEFTT